MSNVTETQYIKLNKENVNSFVEQCRSSEKKEHDLAEITDLDSAGLQGLLSLSISGHSFTNINEDIKEKLRLTGADMHLKF